MRKWGIVITIFYSVILLGFLVPGAVFIAQDNLLYTYKNLLTWISIGIVIAGQAFLLFLSMDTSFQRTRPRAHILVSCLTTGTLWALLRVATTDSGAWSRL